MNPAEDGREEIAIFAPSTQLSVTLEVAAGVEELHVHAAGQGYWVARMLNVLGADPVLCTPVGGETGTAIRALLGDLRTDGLVSCAAANGSYVHDRRSGERQEVALLSSGALDRHAVDDLLSVTLASGLGSAAAVVCGTNLDHNIDADVFERVCRDLRAGGAVVVADLSGDELRAALRGGVDVLKLSHEELVAGEWASGPETDELVLGIRALRDEGARDVVVSRAEDGALAAFGSQFYSVVAPQMSVVESRGAGDSMTAALAIATLRGLGDTERLQLAAAAAALNVTRHGLASGHSGAIERLAPLVEVRPLDR